MLRLRSQEGRARKEQSGRCVSRRKWSSRRQAAFHVMELAAVYPGSFRSFLQEDIYAEHHQHAGYAGDGAGGVWLGHGGCDLAAAVGGGDVGGGGRVVVRQPGSGAALAVPRQPYGDRGGG